jgi:ribonuclease-3
MTAREWPAGAEDALGLRFADLGLLKAALTHRSYLNEVEEPDSGDNERLEYLGDALVDFVAGEYLYHRLPAAREGDLTALRAALVCQGTLARFARRIGLGPHIRLGRGEEANGGRERDPILADAFEAVAGAVYLDQGFPAAEGMVVDLIGPELEAVLAERRQKDAKSRLQEITQRRQRITPEYETVGESGPDHDKRFTVEVRVGGVVLGRAEGRSKARAERRAAHSALEKLLAAGEDA